MTHYDAFLSMVSMHEMNSEGYYQTFKSHEIKAHLDECGFVKGALRKQVYKAICYLDYKWVEHYNNRTTNQKKKAIRQANSRKR